MDRTFAVAIGGAAGQGGVATPGDWWRINPARPSRRRQFQAGRRRGRRQHRALKLQMTPM